MLAKASGIGKTTENMLQYTNIARQSYSKKHFGKGGPNIIKLKFQTSHKYYTSEALIFIHG